MASVKGVFTENEEVEIAIVQMQRAHEYFEISERSRTLEEMEKTTDSKAVREVFSKWWGKKECEQMRKETRYALAQKYNTPLEDLPTETLDEVLERWRNKTSHGSTEKMNDQMNKEIRNAMAKRYDIQLEDLPDHILEWGLGHNNGDSPGIPEGYFRYIRGMVKSKRNKYLGLE